MDFEKYDLISNFKTEEEPLIQIAVQAASLEHVVIGPAYDILGGKLPREKYKGLYIEKEFHEVYRKEIELHFRAYLQAKQMIREREERRGMRKSIEEKGSFSLVEEYLKHGFTDAKIAEYIDE